MKLLHYFKLVSLGNLYLSQVRQHQVGGNCGQVYVWLRVLITFLTESFEKIMKNLFIKRLEEIILELAIFKS